MCCAPVFRAPNGSRSTIPALATRHSLLHQDRKSRSNFLDRLRAGHEDYVINAEALAYMRRRALSGPIIARLAEHPDRLFADKAAWAAHLDRIGITALKVNHDPVTVATEGALWGSNHHWPPYGRKGRMAKKAPLGESTAEPPGPVNLRNHAHSYEGEQPTLPR